MGRQPIRCDNHTEIMIIFLSSLLQGSPEGLSGEDIGIIQMYSMLITFNAYWSSNKVRS